MNRFLKTLAVALLCFAAMSTAHAQKDLVALIQRDLGGLIETYKFLHANPELSHHEQKTSAFIAAELRKLGYQVTERIGKYKDPKLVGYGVVGVLENGQGPVVLVRSDMDGLPVEEKTGLPYASKVRAKDDHGREVPVMHACGHDIHMTSLLGTAKLLIELKDEWRGTVVLLAQPAEETIDGARAMLDDNLYSRIPKPNYAIAIHDTTELEMGKIGHTSGAAMANSTSVDITVRGVGGHGASPHKAKDPVLLAAQIILALQTIVSRETNPLDPAVVTVGSIHGGLKHNIIPDEVALQLTVRSYKEEVRLKLLAAIERIAKGTAMAAGLPPELTPIVKISDTQVTPTLFNDPDLTERLLSRFQKQFGSENVVRMPSRMGSEDFGRFGLPDRSIPVVMFQVGAADPEKLAAAKKPGATPVPSAHSPFFAPVPEPTITAGVKVMTTSVLELLKK